MKNKDPAFNFNSQNPVFNDPEFIYNVLELSKLPKSKRKRVYEMIELQYIVLEKDRNGFKVIK